MAKAEAAPRALRVLIRKSTYKTYLAGEQRAEAFWLHTNNCHREGRAFPAVGLARTARPAIVGAQVILGLDEILDVSRLSRSQLRHAC